jgi:diadenosine tetraphosphate (Ap4A) HIT family hydrolase
MTVEESAPAAPAKPAAGGTAERHGDEGGCVFCAIVAGRAEASLVYAGDTVLAFMDIAPVTPGHILVIPREHAAGLAELDEERGAQMWRVAHRVAKALRRSGLRVEGVNFFLADGEAAFQEVFHTHLHVVPRYVGDGFEVHSDGRRRERAELDADAALVGRALAQLGRS